MSKILIADDDNSLRTFLKGALQKHGHDVYDFPDGGLAWTEIQTHGYTYDLLLTDIVMPKMDGIELSRAAQKLFPDLKIMYMTGFSGMVQGDTKNADIKVINKPFHLRDIVKQVNDVLGT